MIPSEMSPNILSRDKEDEPIMIMMVGLPGSGKSTFANAIAVRRNKTGFTYPVIYSSDKIREELYGDESIQGDSQSIFTLLHRRIKDALRAGYDVIYDATNISKKKRIAFLSELKKINCQPICIVIATDLDQCLKNNAKRERKVPWEVIFKMWNNYNPPHKNEGFRQVKYIFQYESENSENSHFKCPKTLSEFFLLAENFDQHNEHHTLTLGQHCIRCGEYVQMSRPDDFNLLIAALLHDNGKLFTRSEYNRKGEKDGNCHYYNHHCVGAYESMFYLSKMKDADISEITNLIFYHMHPFLQWKDSVKCLERDKALLGEKMYNDVMLLHQADLFAH